MSFHGKSILVTGAAGSIGGAIVRKLIERGATVIAADRSRDSLAPLAAATGARPLSFDLADEADVERALSGLDLHGIVNCAGFGGEIASPQDTSLDVFDLAYRINARGTLLVIKHGTRSMIASGRRSGSIVNVSSQAALVAIRGHVSYAASKSAVDSITRTSALELGQFGIRVNSVNPTAVMTPMSVGYWSRPEIELPFLAAMPLGRWASEDDIAGPIVFLLSDEAAMITGVSLPIDGGYSIQ